MIDLEQIKNKKSKLLTTVFLSVLATTLLTISVGFSALNQNLNIAGDVDYEEYRPTLYNVLKNAALNQTYAKLYDGSHQDSLDATLSTKEVYYWYATSTTTADEILDKWNVIFGGFCWQMIRTTDTGGVKMIYNGLPEDGVCNNTGSRQQIGTSKFNSTANKLSDVGYMNKGGWTTNALSLSKTETLLQTATVSNNYWYSDTIVWNETTSKYELVNPQIINSGDIANTIGKYTFLTTTETYTNNAVNYISGTESNKIYYIKLQNGDTLSNYRNSHTYTYGDNYTNNGNETYTITNPETIDITQFFSNRNDLLNKYMCKNAINNTCEEATYVTSTTSTKITYVIQNKYRFANGFTYENGEYTLNNTNEVFYTNYNNARQLGSSHYTCFTNEKTCETIKYVYHISNSDTAYYVYLHDGNSIEYMVNYMLYDDDINTDNSILKTTIDNWYENNLEPFTEYIDDVIYCNSRYVYTTYYNGWNPNSGSINYVRGSIIFSNSIRCNLMTDSFSVSNEKAKLKYPVGLFTSTEMGNLNNDKLRQTGNTYWLLDPDSYSESLVVYHVIYTDGRKMGYTGQNLSFGIRPAIALKPETEYTSGDGSKDNPYIVDTTPNS